jgi:hypothetical protein
MNLLEFANPGGWWWLLLAVPIALLYILKIRLRRQRVSTLLFWDQLFDEKKPRFWWQRLRHLLSLLLQLVFLLLLVAALVDPLWSWQKSRQRRIVLVVDNSASMQATEADATTRLDQAKRAARALVQSLRGGDRMAILSAGGRPQVAIGMTNHQRSLLSAIEALPATDGPTDVLSAVAVAQRLLADQEQEGEVVVLSDGCFEDAQQLISNPQVTLYGVGDPRDNIGITRYQVRRSVLDAVGYQVLIDVTNFSEEQRSCRVELNLEDELVDVIPLELAPGATETRIVDHTSPSGGRLIATLDVDDALATDDSAIAVLPTRTPVPVVLVTESNLFLQSVLEAIPLVDLRIVAEPPPAAPANGILVLDRKVPQQLPRGRVMVVDPQSSCDAWTLGESIPQPIVASVDADSPLTQHVRLDNVLFPAARLLQFSADYEALIQDPLDQPLFARLRRPGGDIVVLTCSLEKGDLPLRIAFPVLMKNTLEWFQGDSVELRPAVSSGQMVYVNLPAIRETRKTDSSGNSAQEDGNAMEQINGNVAKVEQAETEPKQNLVLVSPSQRTIPIATSAQRATLGPLLETGLWTVRPEAETDEQPAPRAPDNSNIATLEDAHTISIACNLADAAESDLRPRAELTDIGSLHMLALGGRSLWFYLTLLAAGLIVTEWWLYQRRIIG